MNSKPLSAWMEKEIEAGRAAIVYCGCDGGNRENVVPVEFVGDGSRCMACGEEYRIVK